jgi:hypothetical protein
MRHRPWPIVLLALFQLMMPAIVTFLGARFYSIDFFRYLHTLSYLKSPLEFRLFFILPVIASLSIFAVRRWSLPLFFAVVSLSFYLDLSHWMMSATIFPTLLVISTHVVNLMAVSYLLIPAVWSLYVNPKFAWWRSKPRYLLSHIGDLKGGHGFTSCRVLDISKGGAFVESDALLQSQDEVALSFNYSGLPFLARGKIMHRKPREEGGFGYGVEFGPLSRESKKVLNQIITSLKRMKLEQVPSVLRKGEGFGSWLMHLISTGHGLVPDLPSGRKASAPRPLRTALSKAERPTGKRVG